MTRAVPVLAAVLLATTAFAAPPIVTSPAPDSVAVTLYRDQERDADEPIDPSSFSWGQSGFALITETRTVDLPPGAVTIRFEGVASGIEPNSAIVKGPPLREKNRDARLLSQRGLLDAFTGQQVTIRRTSKATGKVTEEPGIIRSDPDRLVLQTANGVEAIYCDGTASTLVFPNVPPDLTAKPTLSVLTADQPGGRQTVTLTYLAGNFDWQANYVATLAPDGRNIALTAWMTMASGDETSFEHANTSAVAGKLEKEAVEVDYYNDPYHPDNIGIDHHCWSTGSDLPPPPMMDVAPPPLNLPPPPALPSMAMSDSITVTARRIEAVQEDLGDLKLYRIPFPTTVAAKSQKQVAFLNKPDVKGEMLYRVRAGGSAVSGVDLLYRIQNKKTDGLGEPIPAGQVTLYQVINGRNMLVGETSIADKAVDEELELRFAKAANVTVDTGITPAGKNRTTTTVTARNANPFPVTFELELPNSPDVRYDRLSAKVTPGKGKRVWRTVIDPNAKAVFTYRTGAIDAD